MATTQDILALGCEALGLKGAAQYETYQEMVRTWHDESEPIPLEADVIEAGEAATAEEQTKKERDESDASTKRLAADAALDAVAAEKGKAFSSDEMTALLVDIAAGQKMILEILDRHNLR